jgi:hypothetical protein
MPVDYGYTEVEDANNIISEQLIEPSTFETVDYAFYDFINEKMNIRAYTNKGWKEVPIVWATAERAFLSKEKKELSDLDGTLIFPIMSIERTAAVKDLTRKGSFFGNSPLHMNPIHGSRIVVARRIVSDKTNNFAIADNRKTWDNGNVNRTPGNQSYFKRNNKKVVYETITMPMPVFIVMTYVVTLRCEYQQQMNQMLQPFATLGGTINSFNVRRDGHKYETFLKSDISHVNNISSFDAEERIYQSQLTFETLGYLIGEGDNGTRPKFIKTENAVEVKIPRERVIMGDIQDFDPKSDFYRD